MITDDRLRLVFTCCHPALAREAQVALTLRLLCGLTTAEIARAFLVPEPTMAARVTRAKKKIAAARIPYRVPGAAELPDRLDAVLTVVHLRVHDRAHGAGRRRPGARRPGRAGALDLARMLRALMPDEPEVRGLLALMLLTDARRDTRVDADGRLRAARRPGPRRWDRGADARGARRWSSDLHHSRVGRFALQAAIAARARGRPVVRGHRLARGSSRSTTRCCASGRRRSSRSTARSRWPRSPARRPRSPRWTGWPPTAGSRATATCRRPGPTCCAGWAGAPRRRRRTTRRWP